MREKCQAASLLSLLISREETQPAGTGSRCHTPLHVSRTGAHGDELLRRRRVDPNRRVQLRLGDADPDRDPEALHHLARVRANHVHAHHLGRTGNGGIGRNAVADQTMAGPRDGLVTPPS